MGIIDRFKNIFNKKEQIDEHFSQLYQGDKSLDYHISDKDAKDLLGTFYNERYNLVSKEKLKEYNMKISDREEKDGKVIYYFTPISIYSETTPPCHVKLTANTIYEDEKGNLIYDKFDALAKAYFIEKDKDGKDKEISFYYINMNSPELYPNDNLNNMLDKTYLAGEYGKGDIKAYHRIMSIYNDFKQPREIPTLELPKCAKENNLDYLYKSLGIQMPNLDMYQTVANMVDKDILEECQNAYLNHISNNSDFQSLGSYHLIGEALLSPFKVQDEAMASLSDSLHCSFNGDNYKEHEEYVKLKDNVVEHSKKFFTFNENDRGECRFLATKEFFGTVKFTLDNALVQLSSDLRNNKMFEAEQDFKDVRAIVLQAYDMTFDWNVSVGSVALEKQFQRNIENTIQQPDKVVLKDKDLQAQLDSRIQRFEDNIDNCKTQLSQAFDHNKAAELLANLNAGTENRIHDILQFKESAMYEPIAKYNNYKNMCRNIQENYTKQDVTLYNQKMAKIKQEVLTILHGNDNKLKSNSKTIDNRNLDRNNRGS